MLDKNRRSVAGKQIPHNAPADAREHTDEGLQKQIRSRAGGPRNLDPHDRKQAEAYRIHDQEQALMYDTLAFNERMDRFYKDDDADDHCRYRENRRSESRRRSDIEDQISQDPPAYGRRKPRIEMPNMSIFR